VWAPLLLELHGLTAARKLTCFAALGDNHFAVANAAEVAFTDNVRHDQNPVEKCAVHTSLNSAKLSSQTPLRFIPDRTLAQSGIRTGSAL
jgi:hypothetical protein